MNFGVIMAAMLSDIVKCNCIMYIVNRVSLLAEFAHRYLKGGIIKWLVDYLRILIIDDTMVSKATAAVN